MKTKIIIALILSIGWISTSVAQDKNKKEIKVAEFKTSAVCNMCKKTLEGQIIYEKGVQKSELDVPTKMFKIWYRADKTNEDALRTAVNNIGYDADSTLANQKAYDSLHPCCKKDSHD